MPGESAEYVRRERITDALFEFERRIQGEILSIDRSECWDVLLNRPPSCDGGSPNPPADPLPLQYETHEGVSLLRVIDAQARNLACLKCELFGRSHCCGGFLFVYYALRDAGVEKPLDWLALEIQPGLYLPDWERMGENVQRIIGKLRDYFEDHLEQVRPFIGKIS